MGDELDDRVRSCGARTRALYPYSFSFEGKKLFGIADEGYARSKLRYWPLLKAHPSSAVRLGIRCNPNGSKKGKEKDRAADRDVRVRLVLSPGTPPILAQWTQIRNLHHDARMGIWEERRSTRVRIQQGQPETPPTGGSVIAIASERHLVKGGGWVVCGFPYASARGNVVLCYVQDE